MHVPQGAQRGGLEQGHIAIEHQDVSLKIGEDWLCLCHGMPGAELGLLQHTGHAIGLADLKYLLRLMAHDHYYMMWR